MALKLRGLKKVSSHILLGNQKMSLQQRSWFKLKYNHNFKIILKVIKDNISFLL